MKFEDKAVRRLEEYYSSVRILDNKINELICKARETSLVKVGDVVTYKDQGSHTVEGIFLTEKGTNRFDFIYVVSRQNPYKVVRCSLEDLELVS
jgi:hypothetical protein